MKELDWDQDEHVVARQQKPIAIFAATHDIILEFPSEAWERENGALPSHTLEIQLHNVDAICRALRAAKRQILARNAAGRRTVDA